ncbi:MAG: hypothetical protein QOF53_3035, partial [Nocardioidaceae bacterium]|nr:hypothetical protein [Nocardioidaceae bacterium]
GVAEGGDPAGVVNDVVALAGGAGGEIDDAVRRGAVAQVAVEGGVAEAANGSGAVDDPVALAGRAGGNGTPCAVEVTGRGIPYGAGLLDHRHRWNHHGLRKRHRLRMTPGSTQPHRTEAL